MFFNTSTIAENDLEVRTSSVSSHTVCLSPQDQDRLSQRYYSSYL